MFVIKCIYWYYLYSSDVCGKEGISISYTDLTKEYLSMALLLARILYKKEKDNEKIP